MGADNWKERLKLGGGFEPVEQDDTIEIIRLLVGSRVDEETYRVVDIRKMLLEDFNTMAMAKPEEYFKEMVDGALCHVHVPKST